MMKFLYSEVILKFSELETLILQLVFNSNSEFPYEGGFKPTLSHWSNRLNVIERGYKNKFSVSIQ